MADYVDGSVVIDTELDTTNFEKGVSGVRKRLEELVQGVGHIGEKVRSSLPDFSSLFQSFTKEAAQIADEGTPGTRKMTDALQSMEATVSHSISAFQQEATAVRSLSSDLDKLEASARNGFNNGGAVLRFKDMIDGAEQKAEALKSELEALGTQKIPTEEYRAFSSSLEAAEDEMGKLLARKVQMEATGTSKTSQAWKQLQYNIKNARLEIDACREKMAELEASGTAFTPGTETAEYRQMAEVLDRAEEQLFRNKALIDAEKIAQAQLNVQAAQEAVITAKSAKERERALTNLRAAQTALKVTAAQNSMNPGKDFKIPKPDKESTDAWKQFGDTLSKVMNTAQKTTFSKLTAGLKSFRRHAGNATLSAGGLVKALTSLKTMLISRLKRIFISSIINEAKEGIGKLAQYSMEFDATMSNLKNRAKELSSNLSVTIGNTISAIEPILTPVIEALSRAVTYLNSFLALLQGKSTVTVAKRQTDSYAKSLDSAAQSAKELKAQVYGFDELNKASNTKDTSTDKTAADLFETKDIESVVPSGLLEALTKIKEAILSGEWREAGKLIAEGLNSMIQSVDDFITGTLRPKGKEWAANIAEVFIGITDGLHWGNIGKTIGDGINAIADTVNTFLTRFDFHKLGEGFGKGINGLFDEVEWNLLGETFANKWNALIDFILGLVTTVKWDNVGDKAAEFVQSFADRFDLHTLAETVATGINGIVSLLQHFFDGVQWEGIGKKFADGINTIFSEVKWTEVGKGLAAKWNALIDAFHGVILKTNWEAPGKSVADAVNGWFDTINWQKLGHVLSQGVTDLLTTARAAIGNTDWRSIGENIMTAINKFQWPDIFQNAAGLISDAIKGLLDLAIGLVEGLNWERFGEQLFDSVISTVDGIDWTGILSRAFELLGAAVGAVAALIWGFCKEAVKSIVDGIDKAINSFKKEIDDAGGNVVLGIYNGIKNGLKNAWTWIKENVVAPIVEGFKKGFGINSPSTVMAELGKYLIQGLYNGISNTWSTITSFFNKTLPELKNQFVDKWRGILSDADSNWQEIKRKITTAFDGAKTNLSKAGETMKTEASTTWSKITTTLTSSLASMYTTATGKIETLKAELTRKWEALKSNFDRTNWNSTGENLVGGLQSGIERSWDTLTSTIKRLGGKLTTALNQVFEINSPSRVWAKTGEYLDKGLQEGIQDNSGMILHTVSTMAKTVNSSLQFDPPEIGDIETITLKGVDMTALSALDRLNLQFDGMIDRLAVIGDVLDRIGGFTMPAFAEGTVIPYQARAMSYTVPRDPSEEGTEYVWTKLEAIEAQLDDFDYLMRQLVDIVQKKNFTIDAGNLAQLVTYYQRKTILDNGGM